MEDSQPPQQRQGTNYSAVSSASSSSSSRKTARVFQPTVLFHTSRINRQHEPENGHCGGGDETIIQQPQSTTDMIWSKPSYMVSLRNCMNLPWLQLPATANSALCFSASTACVPSVPMSTSDGLCPLGCPTAMCPDQKHLAADTSRQLPGIEPSSSSSSSSLSPSPSEKACTDKQQQQQLQMDSSYQVLNLLTLMKSSSASRCDGQYLGAELSLGQPGEEHERQAGSIKQDNVLLNRGHDMDGTRALSVSLGHEKRGKSMKQGRKKLSCPFCSVSCSNHGQLRGHLRCHTGEKPFMCNHDGCTRQFARNEELTRHKRIHTGVRPFVCTLCKKTFGRKDHLQKHAKTHLEPGQKKTFVCQICHQGYSRSDALARHCATAHSEQNIHYNNNDDGGLQISAKRESLD
eukprot:gene5623-6317_t